MDVEIEVEVEKGGEEKLKEYVNSYRDDMSVKDIHKGEVSDIVFIKIDNNSHYIKETICRKGYVKNVNSQV